MKSYMQKKISNSMGIFISISTMVLKKGKKKKRKKQETIIFFVLFMSLRSLLRFPLLKYVTKSMFHYLPEGYYCFPLKLITEKDCPRGTTAWCGWDGGRGGGVRWGLGVVGVGLWGWGSVCVWGGSTGFPSSFLGLISVSSAALGR